MHSPISGGNVSISWFISTFPYRELLCRFSLLIDGNVVAVRLLAFVSCATGGGGDGVPLLLFVVVVNFVVAFAVFVVIAADNVDCIIGIAVPLACNYKQTNKKFKKKMNQTRQNIRQVWLQPSKRYHLPAAAH